MDANRDYVGFKAVTESETAAVIMIKGCSGCHQQRDACRCGEVTSGAGIIGANYWRAANKRMLGGKRAVIRGDLGEGESRKYLRREGLHFWRVEPGGGIIDAGVYCSSGAQKWGQAVGGPADLRNEAD